MGQGKTGRGGERQENENKRKLMKGARKEIDCFINLASHEIVMNLHANQYIGTIYSNYADFFFMGITHFEQSES